MRKLIAVFLLAALAYSSDARAVNIQWSLVGNPGNANDPATGSHYGAVPYAYSIGTYDVTNSQYVEFLNTKDPTGTSALQLYNSNMSNATFGGITYSAGNANGSKYSVISSRGDHPVNYVTWYDTIRFANWLNNGQGSGDTKTGTYTLLGGTPTPSNSITRNAGATVFLPSENEWYKAAYYNPSSNSYYEYPTNSNTEPTASSPTALPNHVNSIGGPNNLTDVGVYTGTTSHYGAFDMGGNVYQWNEAIINSSRGLRGGAFFNFTSISASAVRNNGGNPSLGATGIGFRVASIPEPSTGALAALGLVGLAAWGWRRNR